MSLYPSLYKLHIENNKIETIDVLKGLKGSKIEKIYLKGNSLTKDNNEYIKKIFEMFPNVYAVDGVDKGGEVVVTTDEEDDMMNDTDSDDEEEDDDVENEIEMQNENEEEEESNKISYDIEEEEPKDKIKINVNKASLEEKENAALELLKKKNKLFG